MKLTSKVTCAACGTPTHVNLGSRPTKPKYCRGCRAVIVEPRKSRSLIGRILKRSREELRGLFGKRPNTHRATTRRDGTTGAS